MIPSNDLTLNTPYVFAATNANNLSVNTSGTWASPSMDTSNDSTTWWGGTSYGNLTLNIKPSLIRIKCSVCGKQIAEYWGYRSLFTEVICKKCHMLENLKK